MATIDPENPRTELIRKSNQIAILDRRFWPLISFQAGIPLIC